MNVYRIYVCPVKYKYLFLYLCNCLWFFIVDNHAQDPEKNDESDAEYWVDGPGKSLPETENKNNTLRLSYWVEEKKHCVLKISHCDNIILWVVEDSGHLNEYWIITNDVC